MKLTHLLFTLFVACGAGTNWVGTKIAVDHFPPFLNVAMRFGVLVILFIPWLKPVRGQFFLVMMVALTLGVFQFCFMFLALHISSDVSTIAIANQVYVPFSVILAVIFLGEQVSILKWLAIFIAFSGVLLMGFDPIAFAQLDALAVVMLSALSLAVSSIFMRRLVAIHVFQLQGWVALIALGPVIVISLVFEKDVWFQVAEAPRLAWFAFIYGILAGSLLFHAGWYYLLRRYPVSAISPIMLLMPITGVMSGYLIYGDSLTFKIIVGGCLTMVGVTIITFSDRKSWNRTLKYK